MKTWTMIDAAIELQIPQPTLFSLIRYRKTLPAPSVQRGFRMVYDDAGFEELKRAVAEKRATGEIKRNKKRAK